MCLNKNGDGPRLFLFPREPWPPASCPPTLVSVLQLQDPDQQQRDSAEVSAAHAAAPGAEVHTGICLMTKPLATQDSSLHFTDPQGPF